MRGWARILLTGLCLVGASPAVLAQNVVSQGGAVNPGHLAVWAGNRSLRDGGDAQGSLTNTGISELLQVNPLSPLGSGPDGTHSCFYDGSVSGPYHALCFDSNALGGALISYGAYNGASILPLQYKINGSLIPITTTIRMATDASNAALPTALTNLGLGTANGPAFGSLTLGSPTGGNEGVGTLNLPQAGGIFNDGAAPTGTGSYVRATSPTLVTPALGTPTQLIATNLTGTAASLTAGSVTTNANLTGPVTSVGNITSFASMAVNTFLTGNGTALPNQVALTGLVKGNGAAAPTAYAGTSCTNQFPRSLDLNGAATCATVGSADLAASLSLTTPSIAGGTATGLTGLAIRDTSAAFNVTLAATSSSALSAGRTLTLDMKNVAHTLAFGATANTITFPNTASYTVIGSGDTGTVTTAMLATAPIVKVGHQTFTSTGTYTPAAGLIDAIAECIGGGGGGGGSGASATGNASGGGGGAGSYSKVRLTAAQIGGSQAITIPAASAGGATGANTGTAGGDVSLGALLVCKGGGGGGGAGGAGPGGVAGTGDLAGVGQSGLNGVIGSISTIEGHSAQGGSTLWGASAAPLRCSASAVDGAAAGTNAYGAGGNGGCVNGSASTAAGGAGAKGFVLVTEFMSQ